MVGEGLGLWPRPCGLWAPAVFPGGPGVTLCGPQTLMIRDWWMCTIVSVMFEFLEYSLEHQLPNFSECWWDHVGAGCCPAGGGAEALGGRALTCPPPGSAPSGSWTCLCATGWASTAV